MTEALTVTPKDEYDLHDYVAFSPMLIWIQGPLNELFVVCLVFSCHIARHVGDYLNI